MKETANTIAPLLPNSRFCLRQHGGANRFPEVFSYC